MCDTRKILTLANQDVFYFCNCPDTRMYPGENAKIKHLSLSSEMLQQLQQPDGYKDYVIRKSEQNYEFYPKSELVINEKTPLLTIIFIISCKPAKSRYPRQIFANSPYNVDTENESSEKESQSQVAHF